MCAWFLKGKPNKQKLQWPLYSSVLQTIVWGPGGLGSSHSVLPLGCFDELSQDLGNRVCGLQGGDASPIELGGIPETASFQALIFKIITTAAQAFTLGVQPLESLCSPISGCTQWLRERKRSAGEKELARAMAGLRPVLFIPSISCVLK